MFIKAETRISQRKKGMSNSQQYGAFFWLPMVNKYFMHII